VYNKSKTIKIKGKIFNPSPLFKKEDVYA